MPILDVVKKRGLVRRRLPQVAGILYKGTPKGTSKRGSFAGGDDTDAFRFASQSREITKLYEFYYPEQYSKTVQIVLPFKEVDRCFTAWITKTGKRKPTDKKVKTLWISDGKMTHGRYIKERDVWSEREEDQIPIPEYAEGDKTVKWVGTLYFAIAQLVDAYPAVLFMLKVPKTDIFTLDQELSEIYGDTGDLRGVRCTLYRKEGDMTYELNGKEYSRKNNYVHVRAFHQWAMVGEPAIHPEPLFKPENPPAPINSDPEPPAFIDPGQGAMEAPANYTELYAMADKGKIPGFSRRKHLAAWIEEHCENPTFDTVWQTIQDELFAPPPAEQAASLAETNDPAAILDENGIPF